MRVSLPYDKPIVAHVEIKRRPLGPLLLLYPVFVLLTLALTLFFPQRAGLLGAAQVFGPHLFLPLLLLVPFALMRGALALRLLLLVAAVVFAARYMPQMNTAAPQVAASAQQISVMTWNVLASNTQYDEMGRMLRERPADVVALQETDSDWVASDAALAEIYPYRLLGNHDVPPGMVLLSVYPIVEHGILDGERGLWDIPRLMWAKLDVGQGRTVTVINAHPISSYSLGRSCPLPVCYAPTWRDEQIAAMREQYITPLLQSGEQFILAGDFNITEREPAYKDLSSGLLDAFSAVGTGFGSTWRPAAMMEQEFGLLRIDYLFSSPGITPLSLVTDCTPRSSDHCILVGRFSLDS